MATKSSSQYPSNEELGAPAVPHELLDTQLSRHQLQLGVFDIDGTLRTAKDPWIHLHNHLGFAKEAQLHKEQFFSGQIAYEEWVAKDARLWKGFHRSEILRALDTNPLKEGADTLLGWFKANRIPIIGISTGLDVFNEGVAQQFGFLFIKSNELLFDASGVCTGEAKINVREDAKGKVLGAILEELSIPREGVVAFGDGTADIQLFKIAALSVAISPSKAQIREAATHCLENCSLSEAVSHLKAHFAIA